MATIPAMRKPYDIEIQIYVRTQYIELTADESVRTKFMGSQYAPMIIGHRNSSDYPTTISLQIDPRYDIYEAKAFIEAECAELTGWVEPEEKLDDQQDSDQQIFERQDEEALDGNASADATE